MEQLSIKLQAKSGRSNLWLTAKCRGIPGAKAPIRIASAQSITSRLNNRFAPFIDLPLYWGEPWRLQTHQGRKTFARFVAKRDRTHLHALKEHFGHRSIVMTERAYAGTDYELSELISREIEEEMVQALAESLTAKQLAGRSGRRISARSRFRGEPVTKEVMDYSRARLKGTNLSVQICEFGFCFYRRSESACNGDDRGPNPALRTQSTCVGCSNFVIAPKHRQYWKERRQQYVDYLQSGEGGSDMRKNFYQKIAECDQVLDQLDAEHNPEETQDG